MIIESLLNVFYNVFSSLTSAISIPSLPDNVTTYIDWCIEYIEQGLKIVAMYTPLTYLLSLFGIIIAVELGIKIYYLVMWIIKKIPMASIS